MGIVHLFSLTGSLALLISGNLKAVAATSVGTELESLGPDGQTVPLSRLGRKRMVWLVWSRYQHVGSAQHPSGLDLGPDLGPAGRPENYPETRGHRKNKIQIWYI
jgi:hypothetical protein